MTYTEYRMLTEKLAAQKGTTGEEQSELRIDFTFLNNKRMQRLDKKGVISEAHIKKINAFETPVTWTVLAESWCGDAAQVLPYINKVALLNNNISLQVLLRDDNLELMDAHLTNGARAIPKLIMASEKSKEILNTFGPRPSQATAMVQEFKAKNGGLTPEFKKDLQLWYTKNKGINIVDNLVALLS